MTKHGMTQYVHHHKDPTFDTVLGKWRKEARRAAEQQLPFEYWPLSERLSACQDTDLCQGWLLRI